MHILALQRKTGIEVMEFEAGTAIDQVPDVACCALADDRPIIAGGDAGLRAVPLDFAGYSPALRPQRLTWSS